MRIRRRHLRRMPVSELEAVRPVAAAAVRARRWSQDHLAALVCWRISARGCGEALNRNYFEIDRHLACTVWTVHIDTHDDDELRQQVGGDQGPLRVEIAKLIRRGHQSGR